MGISANRKQITTKNATPKPPLYNANNKKNTHPKHQSTRNIDDKKLLYSARNARPRTKTIRNINTLGTTRGKRGNARNMQGKKGECATGGGEPSICRRKKGTSEPSAAPQNSWGRQIPTFPDEREGPQNRKEGRTRKRRDATQAKQRPKKPDGRNTRHPRKEQKQRAARTASEVKKRGEGEAPQDQEQ